MDFNHCGYHVARNKRITHPRGCLHDSVANIAHCEDSRLAPGFENSVIYLSNQWLEMKRAWVTHSPCALNQHLRFGKIFFCPVHSKPESVSLMVVCPELLTAKVLSICHPVHFSLGICS